MSSKYIVLIVHTSHLNRADVVYIIHNVCRLKLNVPESYYNIIYCIYIYVFTFGYEHTSCSI